MADAADCCECSSATARGLGGTGRVGQWPPGTMANLVPHEAAAAPQAPRPLPHRALPTGPTHTQVSSKKWPRNRDRDGTGRDQGSRDAATRSDGPDGLRRPRRPDPHEANRALGIGHEKNFEPIISVTPGKILTPQPFFQKYTKNCVGVILEKILVSFFYQIP